MGRAQGCTAVKVWEKRVENKGGSLFGPGWEVGPYPGDTAEPSDTVGFMTC